jgi:uncharacterized protein YutD
VLWLRLVDSLMLMNATLNLWFRYFVFNPENENEIKMRIQKRIRYECVYGVEYFVLSHINRK